MKGQKPATKTKAIPGKKGISEMMILIIIGMVLAIVLGFIIFIIMTGKFGNIDTRYLVPW